MADRHYGMDQRRGESLPDEESYESPTLTELGSFRELTAGRFPRGWHDDLNKARL